MRTPLALTLALACALAAPARAAGPDDVVAECKALWNTAQQGAKKAVEWEKAYLEYRPHDTITAVLKTLDEALAASPDHAGLKALKEEISGKRAEVEGMFDKVLDAYKLEEHSEKFSGDQDELLESFRKEWGKDEELLALRIYSDWDEYKRNDLLGLPSKYVIFFEMAYPWEKDPDLVKICYVTGYTAERSGVEPKPPIDKIIPASKGDLGSEYTGLGGLIVGSGWYLAKRGHVNKGLGLGGGGFGTVLKVLGGLFCCFVLVAGVGGGAFFALKKSKAAPEAPGAAPGAPPAPPAPGAPPA